MTIRDELVQMDETIASMARRRFWMHTLPVCISLGLAIAILCVVGGWW